MSWYLRETWWGLRKTQRSRGSPVVSGGPAPTERAPAHSWPKDRDSWGGKEERGPALGSRGANALGRQQRRSLWQQEGRFPQENPVGDLPCEGSIWRVNTPQEGPGESTVNRCGLRCSSKRHFLSVPVWTGEKSEEVGACASR